MLCNRSWGSRAVGIAVAIAGVLVVAPAPAAANHLPKASGSQWPSGVCDDAAYVPGPTGPLGIELNYEVSSGQIDDLLTALDVLDDIQQLRALKEVLKTLAKGVLTLVKAGNQGVQDYSKYGHPFFSDFCVSSVIDTPVFFQIIGGGNFSIRWPSNEGKFAGSGPGGYCTTTEILWDADNRGTLAGPLQTAEFRTCEA